VARKNYSSAAGLTVQGSSLFCFGGSGSRRGGRQINDPSLLTILEIFCFEREKKKALKAFREAVSPENLKLACLVLENLETQQKVNWAQSTLTLSDNRFLLSGLMDHKMSELNLSSSSQSTHQILRALQYRLNPATTVESINVNSAVFERGIEVLEQWGLLVPAPGHIHWGQFRRTEPFCKDFGTGRGTPIDRYYLEKFICQIRPQVKGNTLEIGGAVSNGVFFGFSQATEYHALDLQPSPYTDYAGDAHDPSLIAADSFDSIVCFNVLEHCARPWVVVENIHRWLKTGGKAFCMVPNAQRIHELPRDYWRPLPSALESMFDRFSRSQLCVYGNLVAFTASCYGIACEELKLEELDFVHPDYPVATCIVAEK
jgi:SAM-dependent methyltransferase